MKITHQNEFNSRAYVDYLKIAKTAWEKINEIGDKNDAHYERIIFNADQWRIICFDYAFSTLENFLEHLGFILFADWDSAGKQRSYRQKYSKILLLNECILESEKKYADINEQQLEDEWKKILINIEPQYRDNLANKRNPLKHINSEKHESNNNNDIPSDIISQFNKLRKGTYLDISNDDCNGLLTTLETLIMKAHDFLNKHRLFFKIDNAYDIDDRIKTRRAFWQTFLNSPFASPSYSGRSVVVLN